MSAFASAFAQSQPLLLSIRPVRATVRFPAEAHQFRYKRVRKLGKKGYVRLRTLRRGGLIAVRLRARRRLLNKQVPTTAT